MILHAILLFTVALVGGTMNSVAGGGSFLTFPSLIVSGIAPINANATNTVALWPGSLASVGAYRREFSGIPQLPIMCATSLVGGGLGAALLLHTPPAIFQEVVPFLLLLATLLLTFNKPITKRLGALLGPRDGTSSRTRIILIAGQLVIATYGGYFGGGIGILMLALFGLLGLENIHVMNALKTLLASCINGVAVVTFIVAGAVVWPEASVMLVGAVIGGYSGAAVARRMDPVLVRYVVMTIAWVITCYFFLRR